MNTEKTKELIFITSYNSKIKAICEEFTEIFPRVDEIKYLGFIIDNHLSFKHHIESRLKKCRKLIRPMSLLATKDTNLARDLLKSILVPTTLFGVYLIGNWINVKQKHQIESILRIACKRAQYSLVDMENFINEQLKNNFKKIKAWLLRNTAKIKTNTRSGGIFALKCPSSAKLNESILYSNHTIKFILNT